ncbi:MAG: hybrid sensor histidine kinase/response regulator [Comamonadaceae bacterium]|nr:MAG: hybrid sensor histidine kinase/response regulator [Comamonadaceae bacterium]
MERRIVICALSGQDAELTAKVFASVGIGSIVCANVADLMAQLARGAGALLVVEEVISGPAMRALSEYVTAQPTWSDLPILLMTRSGADSVDVQRAVEHLGNVTLLERPVRTIALIAAARSAIRARQRQYQVRDADQRKDEFLATLAHELRNPLAPIKTSMGILEHVHPDSPPVERVRNVVNRQVNHLTRLVDDLLDVARITTGKVILKKAPVMLEAVVNHAVEISASGIEVKKHQLEVRLPGRPYVLDADQARLVQSVANLLVNAAKFTPEGGHIELDVEVAGPVVTFSVRDDGIGLEPASLTGIFELFAQTPVPGEVPSGLGIGLSLARQFAGMHGGSLTASSEGLGMGTTFVLELPVVQDGLSPEESARMSGTFAPVRAVAPLVPAMAKEQTTMASKVEPAVMAEPLEQMKKILVVDDNVDAADTLEALLAMDGFEVRTVYDGLAAVAAAAEGKPDVVVMDIGMPGMDGYDAARKIRQQAGGDAMVLIALTGWGQTTDRTRASEAGFNHHLVKPVDYDQLIRCLRAES